MSINNLKPGSRATVFGFNQGSCTYKQKLMSMGLVPGAEFIISKLSPVNDMVEIFINGFSLILRRSEAEILKIDKVCM
ncbi:MAG: ferrous iron transport protein A [Legionellales bacterium]|jgi:ferrous iron transport protein A|nr:ferrous iron transport protein A [Legionellales bacterium]